MSIQLLRFREFSNGGFGAVVWIDDSHQAADGSPDPDFIRRYAYGPAPAGLTRAAYLASIKRETKLLVQVELATLAGDPGTPLAGEGAVL